MSPPDVTVIVPAYNAADTLPACLAAIKRMTWPVREVIVFVDGATDDTGLIAQASGARVIRNDGPPRGPAHGRNVAAAAAQSELLFFVDADVVVAPDALEELVVDMVEHDAQAAFGSFDDSPGSRRAASFYANLRHHFVHQSGHRNASTFWTGLGLICRDAFFDEGGFDAERYAHPSIEDVELGVRLIERGHRIRLVPQAQGKHLKDWTLWRVWHTDVARRAYPWSCMLADRRSDCVDLNLSLAERRRAVCACMLLLSLLASLVQPLCLVGALFVLCGYLYLNRAFFSLLARRSSTRGLVQGAWMHWCYHVYATATYGAILLATWAGLRHAAPARLHMARVTAQFAGANGLRRPDRIQPPQPLEV